MGPVGVIVTVTRLRWGAAAGMSCTVTQRVYTSCPEVSVVQPTAPARLSHGNCCTHAAQRSAAAPR